MKILVYQSQSAFGNVRENLDTIERMCRAGAALDADLVIFPELFLSGYNLGQRVHGLAEERDGPSVRRLCRMAASSGVAIITGYPERQGSVVYNSAVAISADGQIVGHHRKVYLFGEREKALFRPGGGFYVFEIAGRKCGLAICYDIEFPEVTRDMKRQGAEIVFVPTANMKPYLDVPTTLARARALENGVAIVYANLCGSEGDQHYTGLSAIIAPDGKDVVRAGTDVAVLTGDLGPALARNNSLPFSSQIKDLEDAQGSHAGDGRGHQR